MAGTIWISENDLKERIVVAAFDLFQRYGYTKTTMAEIARDAGMSAANLYRYFDAKQDIAAACCKRSMAHRIDQLRGIVRDPRLGPAEKLEAYVLAMVAHTHEMASPSSRIGELVATVTRERPAIVHEKTRTHTGLLAEILRLGNETGVFDVADIITTSKDLYSALAVFDVPLFVGLFARREFEQRARGIVRLLLGGLERRP